MSGLKRRLTWGYYSTEEEELKYEQVSNIDIESIGEKRFVGFRLGYLAQGSPTTETGNNESHSQFCIVIDKQ